MLKFISLFFLLHSFSYAAHAQKRPEAPKKASKLIQVQASKKSRASKIPLNLSQAPLALMDFDENLNLRITALQNILHGIRYFNQHEYDLAFQFFLKASEDGGSHEALYFLGSMHLYGQGMPENIPLGLELLAEAMNNGCKAAAFDLGLYYFFKSQDKNLEAARCFLQFPSDPDFKFYWALTRLKSNISVGSRKIKESAQLGSLIAQEYSQSSDKESLELYHPKWNGYLNSAKKACIEDLVKALQTYKDGNFDESFRLFAQALHKIDSGEYAYMLGHMHLKVQKEPGNGLALMYQAMCHGYKPASFDLGLRNLKGDGLDTNPFLAIDYFKKHEDANFLYHLGLLLAHSYKPIEKAQGLDLVKRAAVLGYPLAIKALERAFVLRHDEWGTYLANK